MRRIYFVIHIISAFMLMNFSLLFGIAEHPYIFTALCIAELLFNLFPSVYAFSMPSKRLHICVAGCELLIAFLVTTLTSTVFMVYLILQNGITSEWLWNLLVTVITANIMFWNGITRVYMTSLQIGIKWRLIGIACGMIPVANIYVLIKILTVSLEECDFEKEKAELNASRKDERICDTKYPIMLVHGVFFRDSRYLNYWGRIPAELEKNGARVYYGDHESAAPIARSAEELAVRIREVLKKSGSEKVNIIAHSKGGLDMRYAIAKCGMDDCVATLTTVNTPHRGCIFADRLLDNIPDVVQRQVAARYNDAMKKLGDENPNFLDAVRDLTASACESFNEEIKDSAKVLYRSIGSLQNEAAGGQFPLNLTYLLVEYFDGPNDGLVSCDSFPWGSDYDFVTVDGRRGVSHGDMIDLNRTNLKGFDVREYYVQLVARLKQEGY